jgi:hypothetical protein
MGGNDIIPHADRVFLPETSVAGDVLIIRDGNTGDDLYRAVITEKHVRDGYVPLPPKQD